MIFYTAAAADDAVIYSTYCKTDSDNFSRSRSLNCDSRVYFATYYRIYDVTDLLCANAKKEIYSSAVDSDADHHHHHHQNKTRFVPRRNTCLAVGNDDVNNNILV